MKYVLLSLFCLTMFACKNTPEGPIILVDAEAKSYVIPFKEGSFWVYENDSTKETDSVFCDRLTDGRTAMPEQVHRPAQDLTGRLFWLKNPSMSCECVAYSNNSGDCSNFFVYGGKSLQFEKTSGKYQGFTHSNPVPTVLILNKDTMKFKDVLVADDNLPDGNRFLFAKGVGIIERDIKSNGRVAHWKLKRFHL